jgi:hypothetical protein
MSESTKVVPLFSTSDNEDNINEEKESLLRDNKNENFIYTGASDKKGHSISLQCRVKPWIPREIQIIIESKKFKYKTSSDFIRDAIYWRLKFWMKKIENESGINLLERKSLSEMLAQESEMANSFEEDLNIFKELILKNIAKPHKIKSIISKTNLFINTISNSHDRDLFKSSIKNILNESLGNRLDEYLNEENPWMEDS